ncbi:leucine-rich repeat-containing protein 15-like [Bradysia coprophila]|uniref:leucine-rich repeat-containing protein 15-like n=1 Tax=Bradysia coprophila TaxID=38358 RepID=UPI00187DC330|nr:leucine-rich repeat-containing protein 15-like [Bradysia coprophila]
MHSMQRETLSEMNQLTNIELMYTDPEDLTWLASAISGLANLRSVHCYGYNLTKMSASSFQGVHHLKKLLIAEYTNPTLSSLPPGLFRDLNQLETLILHLGHLSNFSAIDFTGLEKLTSLNINMKQISFIPTKMYIPKSLRYLVLQDNGIRDIASTSFSQMPNLIRLEMSLNQIERLPANAFIGLTDLRGLSLWDNSIDRIENGAFTNLKNLKKLDLRNNKLTALDEYTFKGLRNLKYLNLEGNSISTISVKAFSALPNLVQLILSEQDGLVNIDLNAFPQFVDLQTKTVIYTAISTEPDDFEKKEMERLEDPNYTELFGSFWSDEMPDHQVDLHNLTQSMADQSLILGNLDLSSNRITSINVEKSLV